MKKQNLIFGSLLLAIGLMTVAHAADVGVSVSVSQPGFYGRIDVGRVPTPVLIYSQPMVIERRPVTVVREPIYLRVPPGHEKHWDKHCARYNACGQPVYFVQDNWYREVYEPQYYRESDRRDGGRNDDKKRKKDHGHD